MWFLILLALSWSLISLAQSPPTSADATQSSFFSLSPETLDQQKNRLPKKKFKPPPTPPKFILPPLKHFPGKDQRLSSTLLIFIRKIEVIGNTIFSKEELSTLTQSYENRSITSDELQKLRQELTQYYIDKGYINSGAIIPDQKVGDGTLTIQIIEGELSKTDVTGNDWLRSSYIDERISRSKGPPLNIKNLQERLLLLQQDPLIKGISGELRPRLRAGESQLNIQVKEARPYQLGMEVSNDRSPSIGGLSGKVWLMHRNLTGFGDAAYFAYGRTDGLNDYNASYTLPLNAYDTQLHFYYQNSSSNVVENPFDELDIRSRSETYGVSLNQAFYKTPRQTFAIQVGFEHRSSKTFLLDQPFAFSPGVPDQGDDTGESRISVLRITQDWLDRSQNEVIAFRSTFNIGIDALDATINSSLPDGEFFSWLGQLQWIRRFPFWESQVIFRSDVQLTSDSLLPQEKFSIGGQDSVRGYRENQFVRDNGAVVSLEWRVPVFHVPIPGISKSIDDGVVQLATFVDFGWSNDNSSSSVQETIGSWGLGIRWTPSHQLHSELYWGIPFKQIKEGTEYDIQDSGIHFKVHAQLF